MLYLRTKRLKNHTLWDCTYLHGPYKGVAPTSGMHVSEGLTETVNQGANKIMGFEEVHDFRGLTVGS